MTWVPCELHAHSLHSDGRLTVGEMAREMRNLGLKAAALTDHNTTSGLPEIPAAERETGLLMIPGMELTTFHGHLLSLGATAYIEWRTLTKGTIGSAIDAIHANGALAGVAHPFNPGNPFCTGCFWDFDGPDWRSVDYLEVWSETDPWRRPKNRSALRLWDRLLDEGLRIPGVSSQDFHAPGSDRVPAVTYLGVEHLDDGGRLSVAALKNALARGRVFVTLGPLLSLAAGSSEGTPVHAPGDVISGSAAGSTLRVSVSWDADERAGLWERQVEASSVEVRGNQGVLARSDWEPARGAGRRRGSVEFAINREGCRWIRAELHGRARGDQTLVAFTSPVYLEE
jgi:hypothetical protein